MSSLKKWFGFQSSSSRKGRTSESRSAGHSSNDLRSSSPILTTNNGDESVADRSGNAEDEHIYSRTPLEPKREYESGDCNVDPMIDEPYDEYILQYMQAVESKDLPFGDGSTKVYGYENFGNTCYCNSVLQCLYNMTEFRTDMLKYPTRDPSVIRRRKSHMPGSKPRIFTEASFASQAQGNNGKNDVSGSANSTSQTLPTSQDCTSSGENSRKSSLKFFKSLNEANPSNQSSSKTKSLTPINNDLSSAASSLHSLSLQPKPLRPVHTVVMPSDPLSEKLHENYNRIIVGRTQGTAYHPTIIDINHTIVEGFQDAAISTSVSSNSSSPPPQSQLKPPSIEQRKKAALVKGPVINIDESLADYLPKGAKPSLYSGLKDIFECINENESPLGVVSPSNFVEILKHENVLFSSTMHQDAHEFLNFLLNELSDSIKRNVVDGIDSNKQSFIEDLFMGSMFNSTKCFTCDNVTSRDEPFLDFPVEIQDDEEIKIQDILRDYKHREMLSGVNKFYCDKCCGLQEAERTVGLKTLPRTLAIHLKRFKYSELRNCNAKLFNRIHYPLTLEVCSSFDKAISKNYELNGIVVHMGGGPHHGHYVSICKNDVFGWLLFDDETVESINEETVLKFVGDSQELTTAYVLFYKEIESKNEVMVNFEENIEQLLKEDESVRRKSSVATNDIVLEDVPEETTNTASSKQSKRKSRIFGFKRSAKG